MNAVPGEFQRLRDGLRRIDAIVDYEDAARRAHEQQARPTLRPTPEERVEPMKAATDHLPLVRSMVPGGDEPRKHLETAAPDDEVMVSAPVPVAAELHHTQPSPLGAVERSELLKLQDAVDQRLERHLHVGGLRLRRVEQQDRRVRGMSRSFRARISRR